MTMNYNAVFAAATTLLVFTYSIDPVVAQSGGREQGPTSNPNCIAYEHRDYKGARMTLYAGRNYNFVGSAWNDKISSFKIGAGCRVTAYHHRNFKGESTVFTGFVKYTGDLWNDQISSWKCSC